MIPTFGFPLLWIIVGVGSWTELLVGISCFQCGFGRSTPARILVSFILKMKIKPKFTSGFFGRMVESLADTPLVKYVPYWEAWYDDTYDSDVDGDSDSDDVDA